MPTVSDRWPNAVLDWGGKPGRATPLWLAAPASATETKAPSYVVFAAAVQNSSRAPGPPFSMRYQD
jgi:hypothetical protein